MTAKRLTQADWLSAGMSALVEVGPDMLKAEPLARRLGTTKGSFYWHFTDVPAFHSALLAAWEVEATADAVAAVASEDAPAAKLRHLAQNIAEKRPVDPSIRAWAHGNSQAQEAVVRVDAKRSALMQGLLSDLGVNNPEMARIIYAACIGMEELQKSGAGANADAIGSLVDLILALR